MGVNSSAGLFSLHDKTGKVVGDAVCVGVNGNNATKCPSAPLDLETSLASAIAKGVPKSVAGGGTVPPYTQELASSFNVYKTIWTPTWLAWMVNNVVMRNETYDVRPNYVPWRPVTMRPLLRTNVGSAPIIKGTYNGA